MSIWVKKIKVLHTSNIFVGVLVKWRATYILPSTLSIKTVSKIVWSTWLTTQQSEPKEYLSSSVSKQVIIIVVQVLVVHRKALRVLLWNETVWSWYQCVTRLHSHDGALQWILVKSFPNPPRLRRARVQRVKSWEQGCDCMRMCACFCKSWHGVFPHCSMVSVLWGIYIIILYILYIYA